MTHPSRILVALGALTAALALAAPAAPAAGGPAGAKVKIEDGDGRVVWKIKAKDDGAKVVDGAEKRFVRIKDDGRKVKIKDASGTVVGYVTGDDDKLKLKDASKERVLFVVKARDAGGLELEDGAETVLVKVKAKGYGFKIVDASGTTTHKVKVKQGKVVVRDAGDRTVLSTKSSVRPVAMAALVLAPLSPEQRLGLFHRLQRSAR